MPPHRAPGALSFGLLFVLLVALSAEAREKWGPFRGQIVNAETGHPIAGTAVLVVWWEAVPTPVQTNKTSATSRPAECLPDDCLLRHRRFLTASRMVSPGHASPIANG